MKRIITLLFALTLFCLSSVFVNADSAKYEDAWELYKSWNGKEPADICGIWLTDDETVSFTFGIRDDKAGEALREMILESVENKESVNFVTQKYLKSELLEIKETVDEYISKNIGIEATYLDEKRNRVEICVLAERVNDRTTQSIVKTIEEKYGDRVNITYEGDMFKQTILAVGNGGAVNSASKWGSTRFIILVICVIIVLLASGYMVIMTKRGQLIEWADKHGFKSSADDKTVEDESEENEDLPADDNSDDPSEDVQSETSENSEN